MNILKQTNSLAMMFSQEDQSDTSPFELEIPRLKKQDMKNIELPDIQQVVYTLGQKTINT